MEKGTQDLEWSNHDNILNLYQRSITFDLRLTNFEGFKRYDLGPFQIPHA